MFNSFSFTIPPLDLFQPQRYTQLMRQRYMILLLPILIASLLSCSPGHLGSNEIAFIRDGHLWTIDPNGENAYAIVTENTPVISYAWSPTHQVIAYRSLDADFAKTASAKHVEHNPLTDTVPDLPSTVNTISIDGGSSIPIMFSNPDTIYSQPIWNETGTRMIFRQLAKGNSQSPDAALWWVAQNDQPGGIATKILPHSFSIPSLTYTSQSAIGNDLTGVFSAKIDGQDKTLLIHGNLPGHPLPASLERVLPQPIHQKPALLYARDITQTTGNQPITVQLLLYTTDGQNKVLTTCACTQFTWSPDGNEILYSAGSTFTVLYLKDNTSFNIAGAYGSIPYWSPDSQFLLLDGPHSLILLQLAKKQQQTLLHDTVVTTSSTSSGFSPQSTNALLQPISNNLWASDSRHFLFLTRTRLLWQNHSLHSGNGLYTVTIDADGHPQGKPVIVDSGNDTQAGWTYEDANTSFLF